ncbi:MAG: hypothetical protein R6X14_03630 [bacterium]
MSMAPLARHCLTLLLLAAPGGLLGSGVTPQSVVLDLPGGARKRLEFTLVNEDLAQAQTYRYFAAPFVQRENGAYRIADQPDSLFSCDHWFNVETTFVTIPPNEGKLVTVDVVVPANRTGTSYGAVIFDQLPGTPSLGQGSASVGMVRRTPAFVEITSGGQRFRPQASLVSLQVVPAARLKQHYAGKVRSDALGVAVGVRNDGVVSFPNRGRLVIRDLQGRRVRAYPLGGGGKILPGATVELVSVIPPLRPGSYSAEVTVETGTSIPLKGSAPFNTGGAGPTSGKLTAAPVLEVSTNRDDIVFDAAPGATRSAYVTLRNEGARSIPLNVSLGGLRNSPEGRLEQADSVASSADCRPWLAVEPASFILDSGATLPIRVTAVVPATSPGGKYADIMFEQVVSSDQPASALHLPVLLTVRGDYARRAEITRLSTMNPAAWLTLTVANTGDVHLYPKARVMIHRFKVADPMSELDYDRIGLFDLSSDAVVLPGDSVVLAGRFEGTVPRGKYRLNATVDCGEGLVVTDSETVVVK